MIIYTNMIMYVFVLEEFLYLYFKYDFDNIYLI